MGNRHYPYFRKFLVGFNDSLAAERAVEVGMELASCLDAELFVLAVAYLPKPATTVEVHASFDDAHERYIAAMDGLVRHARENGIQITTKIVAGDPAQQILHRFALSKACGKFDFGHVLKHAYCPAMSVP